MIVTDTRCNNILVEGNYAALSVRKLEGSELLLVDLQVLGHTALEFVVPSTESMRSFSAELFFKVSCQKGAACAAATKLSARGHL